MITAFLITILTAGGIACAFTGLSMGAALAAGAAILVLALFILTTLADFAVTASAWAVAAVAVAGWIYAGLRLLRTGLGAPITAAHPAIVLTLIISAVFAVVAPDGPYLPHAWDEMSGWATWMKQILAANVWYSDAMMDGFPHYPKGWPLLAVYPQVFMEGFDGARAIAVATALQIAVLAALYDAFRSLPALRSAPAGTSSTAAWAIVLALVAIEAMWKVVPNSLEVERPILYMTVALFAVGIIASIKDKPTAWVALGVILAATLSMKTSMVSAFVPTLVFTTTSPGTVRQRALRSAAIVMPGVALVIGWNLIGKPPVPSPTGLVMAPLGETLMGFGSVFWGYLTAYKAPVTAVATVGFAWAILFDRGMWRLPVAWLAFACIYIAGLIALYLFVMHASPTEAFPSLQRYVRLPVRLYHVFGCALFLYEAFRLLRNKLPNLADARIAHGVAALAFVAVAGLIYMRAGSDVADLDIKAHEDQTNVHRNMQVRDEATALSTLIAASGYETPMVAVIAQGDDGAWHNAAGFYSVNTSRQGPVQIYRHLPSWSWGETAINAWMQTTTADDMAAQFKATDIVWPLVVDDWMRSVLARLADTQACATNPTDYFLVRDADRPSGFRCVLKK